jgi:hypothetical protein
MTADNQPPKKSRLLPTLLGVVLVVGGVIGLVWNLGRSTDTQTQTLNGPVDRVEIEVTGSVTLDVSDTPSATVEREWLMSAPDVSITLDGGTMRIVATCGFLQFGCHTSVEASAPAGAEVVVTTAAGNVVVDGFQAGVDLTTSAGNVVVSNIVGPAVLRSSAGRIEGDITDGDIDAETSAGRIELDVYGTFATVSAETSAGSVELTLPDGVYRVDADTSAGNVSINVPTDPSTGPQIVARSSAGSITINRR